MTKAKILCLPLVLVLLLCSGCVRKEPAAPQGSSVRTEKFVIDEAVKLVETMDALAGSQSYIRTMSASEEILSYAGGLRGALYGSPQGAVLVRIDAGAVLLSMQDYDAEEYGSMEDVALEQLRRRMPASLGTAINAQYGATWLATASILNVGKSYIKPDDWSGDMAVVLEYNGKCVYVSFQESGDGVVSANAVPMAAASIDEFCELFGEMGLELDMTAYSKSELQDILDE